MKTGHNKRRLLQSPLRDRSCDLDPSGVGSGKDLSIGTHEYGVLSQCLIAVTKVIYAVTARHVCAVLV